MDTQTLKYRVAAHKILRIYEQNFNYYVIKKLKIRIFGTYVFILEHRDTLSILHLN